MQLPWPSAVKFLMARKFNVERALVLYQQHEIMRSVGMEDGGPSVRVTWGFSLQDTGRVDILWPQLGTAPDGAQPWQIHHPALQRSKRRRHRPVQPEPSRAQRGDAPDCPAVCGVPGNCSQSAAAVSHWYFSWTWPWRRLTLREMDSYSFTTWPTANILTLTTIWARKCWHFLKVIIRQTDIK